MLDTLTQETLNLITSKDVSELTSEDAGFLRARRDYLSDQEKSKFAVILKGEVVTTSISDDPTQPKLDRKALMHEAKEMGLQLSRDMTAAQVKALIDNANFEKEEQEEAARDAETKRLAEEAAAQKEAAESQSHKGNPDDMDATGKVTQTDPAYKQD